MNLSTGSVWRLDELVRRSQRLLDLLPVGAGESRRVRWQPDARLVRYYTTLGLLDRPAELRGRTAYYCDRHLLQLLAIKTLQARGLSLQTIQVRLAGQPDAVLVALIGLPPEWAARLVADGEGTIEDRLPSTDNGNVKPARVPARFWERTPRPTLLPSEPSTVAPSRPAMELLEVTLAPGARLLLDRRRYPEFDDRLETALQTLGAALRAIARSTHDPSDGGKES